MYTDLHSCLVHAVTRFDRTRRTPQSPYALALYLNAVQRAMAEILKGATIEAAIREQFNGSLAHFVLKFVRDEYKATKRD